MRTLILHLTTGETKEWETNIGPEGKDTPLESCYFTTMLSGLFSKDNVVITPTFAICTDKAYVNLNHVVWMEEKI